MKIRKIVSTNHQKMVEANVEPWNGENINYENDSLILTGGIKQSVKGFGGCFNEMGWDILRKLPQEKRDEFFLELFGEQGCRFNSGRLPIGANDYSLEWYSCDEVDGDYELTHFNIDRDQEYTIPYIREAMKYQPDLYLFASPWSPPTWMKTKKAYNYGRIKMEPEVLKAYANYFRLFIEAYEQEDITINQVHIQNEPMADQKFPSCLWYGEDMRIFIRDYIGPVFKNNDLKAEIWLGTINGPFVDFRWPGYGAPDYDFYEQFANTILSDHEARKYISGVGVQWGGKHQLEQVRSSYPDMRIMQTESECGDGLNDWAQAEYIFTQMRYYFHQGAERYIYWNMILPVGGESTWGWKQNALCAYDQGTDTILYHPEYYLMKHFSAYVDPEAVVLGTSGQWNASSVVFRNPDNSIVIVIGNGMDRERTFIFDYGEGVINENIDSHSICTFVIGR
ncbi:MAG: glycoside hydrolase family 30 protein [Eubacteriales bacterium]|nr:glycoside hydrolase family 30 protein [Eubacteriales bacterium]